MDNSTPGIITKGEFTDYLYRVATRALIRNDRNEILLVREQGHDWWDLPGGGLEYDESIYEGLKRELFEEVGLRGKFDYKVVAVQEPRWNERAQVMQMNVIYEVTTSNTKFSPGAHGVDIAFMPLEDIYKSNSDDSRLIASLNAVSKHNSR